MIPNNKNKSASKNLLKKQFKRRNKNSDNMNTIG